MHNNLFTIGSLTIHGYGLMIALGIIFAYVMAEARGKKMGFDSDQIWSVTIWCVIGGFIGAKILYIITDMKDILADPALLKNVANGFVIYGGILGGILTMWICCRRKKLNMLKYLDLAMPSVALAQGMGRIGCFLAGCCYGVETDSAFSIVFTESEFAPNGVHLVPTQLISSGLDFLNCLVLLAIAKRSRKDGMVAACYLLFYSVGRFILEFFRGDIIRGKVGVLSTSQFISIWVALAAVILLVWINRKKDTAAAQG